MSPLPLHPSVVVDARRLWRPARTAARLCRRAGVLLLTWADRLGAAPRPRPDPAAARLEFHADACAPEGALYVDGQLLGRLDGVTRL